MTIKINPDCNNVGEIIESNPNYQTLCSNNNGVVIDDDNKIIDITFIYIYIYIYIYNKNNFNDGNPLENVEALKFDVKIEITPRYVKLSVITEHDDGTIELAIKMPPCYLCLVCFSRWVCFSCCVCLGHCICLAVCCVTLSLCVSRQGLLGVCTFPVALALCASALSWWVAVYMCVCVCVSLPLSMCSSLAGCASLLLCVSVCAMLAVCASLAVCIFLAV